MSKKILLIGAGGDIGSAISSTLSASGYDVTETRKCGLDLSKTNSIDEFISANPNPFNHLVFTAATNNLKNFEELSTEEISNAINVNLLSFIRIAQHCVKEMDLTKPSSIIMISSLFAKSGRAKRLPYVLSKHAMAGACKTLAIELGPKGIRVNTVSPGYIDTKLTRKNVSAVDREKLVKRIPLGRLGCAKEVAAVVKFLISEDASYVTGTEIIVDGGYIAGGFFE